MLSARSMLRNLAGVFNRRALHVQTNSEERDLFLARIGDRMNHALRYHVCRNRPERGSRLRGAAAFCGGRRINIFRFDPLDHHALAIRQAAVPKRLAKLL